MSICINPEYVNKIKNLDLSKMSSFERVKAFDEIMGGGGKDINLLYEQKLLLKNQDNIVDKFIDDISGVSLEKKNTLKQKAKERLDLKNKIIDEKELLSIVNDTLNRKYKLDIDEENVSKMFKIRKEIKELEPLAKGTPDGSPEKLAWGSKIVELSDEIADLKNTNKGNLLSIIKDNATDSISKIRNADGVLGKTGKALEEVVSSIVGLPAKGIKAAWDASFIFRQGLKVLTADPSIWAKNTGQGLSSWLKVYDKDLMEDIVKGFKADIVTRDLYQDAIKSKLAIGVVEDFFPTNIAEKIPAIGGVFKASDDSFTMFSQGSRMDLFEKYVKTYIDTNGSKPPKEVMDSMAQYVNALTGRGGLAKAEAASSWLNQLLFSARYQVANLKTFSDPLLAKTPEVRAIAAKNLAVHASAIFGVMATMSAFTDVGFDARETTFGKVRIPGSKKWVDVTGGLGQYISTLVRMSPGVVGKVKYGERDGFQIFTDFLSGKLAPVPGAIRDYYAQRDFEGEKPTVTSTLNSLFVPITVSNIIQNSQSKEELNTQVLGAVFDMLGAGVSQPQSKREGSYKSALDIITGN